jgi:hypothetical protein
MARAGAPTEGMKREFFRERKIARTQKRAQNRWALALITYSESE